jgi:hypothetical protein
VRGFEKLAINERLYIACVDYDFSWRQEQVKRAVAYWEQGMPLLEIAAKFKRRQEEVLLLLVDLATQGEITGRPGGILGEGR